MEKLIALLFVWISTHTPYIIENLDDPNVVLVPQQELYERATKNHPGYSGLKETHVDKFFGLYDAHTKTIYLSDTFNPDKYQDREKLLHELVHHVQRETRASFECDRHREKEAYILGGQYLWEKMRPDPIKHIRKKYIRFFSNCPKNVPDGTVIRENN